MRHRTRQKWSFAIASVLCFCEQVWIILRVFLMSLREGTPVITESLRGGKKHNLYAAQRARAWAPTQEGPSGTAEHLQSL